ncbi:hypothetical protein [Algibacter luteus]|nr:hypothetical protein [Algibacter luteus]WJJ97415.1 hypothetical protein O5O44_03330 [Algibacter luteus]
MKTLKITLILALFFVSLTSCTKQDLTEDDIQVTPDNEVVSYTGGGIDD